MKNVLLVMGIVIGINSLAGYTHLKNNTKDVSRFEMMSNHKNRNRRRISAEEAKKIALKRVPGANMSHIHDFEFDENSYEGEIHYRGYEYEFEIDAYTGQITDWDVEKK